MAKTANASYIPALDGLRALSIMLVFLAHLGFDKIVPGGLGVTVFFFISGYLITNLLLAEYAQRSHVDLKLFYARRLLRLYPPLLFMLCFLVVYILVTGLPFTWQELYAALFYYVNYYNFYSTESKQVLLFLWSLAVEEHFYLVFPFIFLLLARSPRKLTIAIGLLLAVPLVLRYIGNAMYDDPERAMLYCYNPTHTRFDSILYGCLASVLLYHDRSKKILPVISSPWLFITALLVMMATLVIRNETFRNTIRFSLQGGALFVLIPAIVQSERYQWLNNMLSAKPLVYIGKLSYSIYLFHSLVFTALASFLLSGQLVKFYVGAVVISALLSMLCYYTVEKPLGRLRKRLHPAKTT
ncbi:acyltransferase family protein [Hufsiella ginkgonis]|uniref:Acyltransferase family protein n=1 Tax=Hufsiella ginkgonis TaxID=2695274 RepID=A0A7K1XTX2_9SPHI|nr:acyltransferase [Hufsiella ginkgonis]MXV14471.1 acyltransferase family protein [Hufsiella ginkgonis]